MTAIALLATDDPELDRASGAAVARAELCLVRRAAREALRFRRPGLAAYVARSGASPCVATQDSSGKGLLWVALAGWLHEREELTRRLGSGSGLSDPELVAALWRSGGADALARLAGSFVLVVADASTGEVCLARDWIGTHCLFYRVEPHRLLVASEALAVLAMAALPPREEEPTVAALLANAAPAPGATCFAGVRAILPGQLLRYHGGKLEERHLAMRPRPAPLEFRNLAEASAGLLDALGAATTRTLAGARSPALSLSGGIDSTAIAVAMARTLGPGVRSYTWSLPGFPDADEAPFVREAAAALKLDARIFDAESLGPWLDDQWPVLTDAPLANLYRLIKQAMYRQAADDGTDVVLDGVEGDALYPQPSRWLIDAVHDRRGGVVWQQLRSMLATTGARGLWRDAGVRGLVKHLIGRRLFQRESLDWLQEPWRSSLADTAAWPPWHDECRDPDQCRAAMGLDICDDSPPEAWFADPLGVEIRHPYRDAELIAFMLGMPGYWVTCEGMDKALTREMLRTRVPSSIWARPKSGSLEPFASHWLWELQAERVNAMLWEGARSYERYLDPAAVRLAYGGRRSGDESFTLLLWNCISYESWRKAYTEMAKW